MRGIPNKDEAYKVDLRKEKIEKILLVRPNFRMGNSILSIPAIFLFRRNYPAARIDFVGSPISKRLYENLPIDNHYQISRRIPASAFLYPALLREIRSVRYDLAVEVSCSQSALGAFFVGLSGARLRVGRTGKWDSWYSWKIPKPIETNKYRMLPNFISTMGLDSELVHPKVVLSPREIRLGREKLIEMVGCSDNPIVAVFVGGKKRRGKRWPKENFLDLIARLATGDTQVIVFAGPEEKDLLEFFKRRLKPGIPFTCEPDLRLFAAMLSGCQLFVTCDSGPMHLACALGVRTVAIFQNQDFNHWGPPAELARVLYHSDGVSVDLVQTACKTELSRLHCHNPASVDAVTGLRDQL
jgi:heptosyltransferase-3